MTTEHQSNGLIPKLAQIMGEISSLPKEGHNQGQHFDFVTIYQMLEAARPRMAQAGIIMYPEILDRTFQEGQTRAGAAMTVCYLTIQWTVTDGESTIVMTTVGEAHDSGDKAANKAQTAAHKQALSKLLMIAPDEDADAESPPERPAQPQAPVRATGDDLGACPEHGVPYFQTPRMRSAAHRTDDGGWCNKADAPKPARPREEPAVQMPPDNVDNLASGWFDDQPEDAPSVINPPFAGTQGFISAVKQRWGKTWDDIRDVLNIGGLPDLVAVGEDAAWTRLVAAWG